MIVIVRMRLVVRSSFAIMVMVDSYKLRCDYCVVRYMSSVIVNIYELCTPQNIFMDTMNEH